MRKRLSARTRYSAVFVAAIVVAAAATSGWAETYTVTRTDDAAVDGCDVNGCTLREAIIAANANPGTDTVSLPTPGSYVLSIAGTDEDACQTGDLDILENVEIIGLGAPQTVISAAGLDRVLHIQLSVSAVLLSGVTVRDGSVASPPGGGIFNGGGTLTVDRCAIVGNTAGSAGGGIFQPIGRTLVVTSSTFSDNVSLSSVGDAIGNTQGTVELTNCTFRTSDPNGVPILNNFGTIQLTNSTVVQEAGGSAVFTADGDTTITNSVVRGGCIVTGTGATISAGGNLESPGDTCGFDQPSDIVNVPDPGLLAFAYHGGQTRTYAPDGAASPVVDTALNGPCPGTDQRGVDRPLDGDGDLTATCDRGSVEYEPPLFADGFETGGTTLWTLTFP